MPSPFLFVVQVLDIAAHVLSKLHSDCLADLKVDNNSEFTD